MDLLKRRIIEDGTELGTEVVKVDSFLNHQLDIGLFMAIGKEISRRFGHLGINKILTIESSGIGIAAIAAQHFGSIPVIFAKKTRSRNLDGALYTAKVHSFTKDITYDVQLSKKFLGPQDTVLILDDFLARGQALLGLIDIVRQAGAQCAGCGIVIEKQQQGGGALGHIAVGGTVEAVAADLVLLIVLIGQGVDIGLGRHRLVEGGVKHSHLGHVGTHHVHAGLDAGDVGGVVQGG